MKVLSEKEFDARIKMEKELTEEGLEVFRIKIKKDYIQFNCKNRFNQVVNRYLMRKRVKMSKEYLVPEDKSNPFEAAFYIRCKDKYMDLICKIFKIELYDVQLYENIHVTNLNRNFDTVSEFKKNFNQLYRQIKFNYIK